MRTKRAVFQISDFKAVDNTRSFTCYGNVKNVVDHARDRVIDGAYRDSIANHKNAGTMPKCSGCTIRGIYRLVLGQKWKKIQKVF